MADEARPDFVVLPRGDAFQIDELSELAESVTAQLRQEGKSLLIRPAQAFEALHSRSPRTLDADRLRTLTEKLHGSVQRSEPAQAAEFAYAIFEAASSAPEALIDDAAKPPSVRYSITQACFEGIRAHSQLNKLAAARRLTDWCSALTWLVESDRLVRPDVREVLLASVREYEFDVATRHGSKIWLQGNEITHGPRRIRTVPGTILPVAVDCGDATRVHSVEVSQDAKVLALQVDCAFDNAVRSDDRGLWVSSSAADPDRHALEIARILGTNHALILSKKSNRYSLRAIGPEMPAREVELPLIPSDVQLASALQRILQAGTSTQPQQGEPTRRRIKRPERWSLWTGGTLLATGVAGQITGWLLYQGRSEQVERIYGQLQPSNDLSRLEWTEARAPMLGVAAGSSIIATAGLALLASSGSSERIPWAVAIPSGAAGLGLGAWGIADLARGESCDGDDARECVRDEQQRDRGALLLIVSAPLFVLPIAKLARINNREQDRFRLAFGASEVTVSGRWCGL